MCHRGGYRPLDGTSSRLVLGLAVEDRGVGAAFLAQDGADLSDLVRPGGAQVITAYVPLSEMFGYVGDLRSKTQGRANYSMVFDSYAEVPANVSKEIIAKATGE